LKKIITAFLAAFLWLGAATAQVKQTPSLEQEAQQQEVEETGHARGETSMDLWKLANFGILMGIFAYAAYKKGGAYFRRRTESILRDLEASARMKREAEERYAEVEKRLAAVGTEIEMLREQAREESAAEGERVRAETRRELEKIRLQAEQDIASASKAAAQELREHAARLAISLAEQKIRAQLTPEADAALVAAAAAGMGSNQGREAVVS